MLPGGRPPAEISEAGGVPVLAAGAPPTVGLRAPSPEPEVGFVFVGAIPPPMKLGPVVPRRQLRLVRRRRLPGRNRWTR